MVRRRFSPDNAESLRANILRLIADSAASAAEVLKALAQCQAHLTNRSLLEQALKECGLRASGFITSEDLELYFDVVKGKREMGYISKGWDDPGFRVGDVVVVPTSQIKAVRDHAQTLMKYCATRGVTVSGEKKDGSMEFQMDSVIYSDGFNKKVFAQVLHCLAECREKATELFGSS
jgi:hypothetical protein